MRGVPDPNDCHEQRSGSGRAGWDWRPTWLLYLIPVGMITTFVGFGSYMFNQMLGIESLQYVSLVVLLLATCIWTVATILVIGSAVSSFVRWIGGKEAEDPD